MDDDLDNQAQAYDPIVEEFATWARHPGPRTPHQPNHAAPHD
jgi:hypothetical protein